MPLAITQPVAILTTTSASFNYSLAAFTPAANSLLVAYVVAANTIAVGSMSGGGLTWTRQASALHGTNDTTYLFTASVDDNPVSTTINFNCAGDIAGGCLLVAFQVTGQYVANPIFQVASNAGNSTTVTVSLLPTRNNGLYIFGFGAGTAGSNPPNATTPTNWTQLVNGGYTGPVTGCYIAYRIQGENEIISKTINKPNVNPWAAMFIEINEAPVPDALKMMGHGT